MTGHQLDLLGDLIAQRFEIRVCPPISEEAQARMDTCVSRLWGENRVFECVKIGARPGYWEVVVT